LTGDVLWRSKTLAINASSASGFILAMVPAFLFDPGKGNALLHPAKRRYRTAY